MKRFKLPLLLSILLLTGCGSTSSVTTDNAISADVNSSGVPYVSPSPEKSVLTSYEDKIINCQYDSSLLKAITSKDTPDSSYGWILTASESDAATSITNGDCVYVCTYDLGIGENCESMYNAAPATMVQALFDGIFQRNEDLSFSINKQSDGFYEYSLTQSGYLFKGKLFSVNGQFVTVLVYRVSDDLTSELKNAFENCYNSIKFIKADEPNVSTTDEHLNQSQNDAEKMDEPTIITNGPLYDSITSIYHDVSLRDVSGSLGIQVNLPHTSYEDDSVMFFNILTSICESCQLEKEYDSVSFIMMVDGECVTILSLIDYTASNNFTSAEPVVLIDEYDEPIANLYLEIFSAYDIEQNYENNLNKIKDKYSVSD